MLVALITIFYYVILVNHAEPYATLLFSRSPAKIRAAKRNGKLGGAPLQGDEPKPNTVYQREYRAKKKKAPNPA